MRHLKKIIQIKGAVQGVGFRPFVYKIANKCNLLGEVCNNGLGVVIYLQCTQGQLNQFLTLLQDKVPVLANITDIRIQDDPQSKRIYNDFSIGKSNTGKIATIVIPDACICSDCIADITDKNNRRYGHAFTNCTHCGPRFSIVRHIPYDRKSTSMSHFPMCKQCKAEYENPNDRRFHAQPNSCPDCGPKLQLIDASGQNVVTDNRIDKTCQLLNQGKIIAIKGIGGFHLACLATKNSSVRKLRRKKNRRDKPFALMAKNSAMIKRTCSVSTQEALLLKSSAAPIVLLSKKNNLLSEEIAPKQTDLGFMLPYSPLHYLLLDKLEEPLVLTSANKSEEPQIIDNQFALEALNTMADYFLMHDRDIVNRVDDSVVKFSADALRVIRRSRGYAPVSLSIPKGFKACTGLLAVGAELKNTFCLLTHSGAIVSQHIGDLKTLESYQNFQHTIDLYQQLYATTITQLACDFHPDYLSSKYADNLAQTKALTLTKVQHHHAHVAACLFEHGRAIDSQKVLGVVWDGIGFGADHNLWGGEFLLADYLGFNRLANFEYVPLLGGDKATHEPWRMAYAYFKQHKLPIHNFFLDKPVKALDALLESKMPLHYTSSVGRLFDAVAYMLNICKNTVSYEAQAAIELENLAKRCPHPERQLGYELELKFIDKRYQVNSAKMWSSLLADLQNNVNREDIAYRFHLSLIKLLVKSTVHLNTQYAFDTVVLSGGVFHNQLLLELALKSFDTMHHLTVLIPSRLPLGDGGISLGQAAVCAARGGRE